MKKTTIYLVRHGQSEHNLSGSLGDEQLKTYGSLGSSLTEEGRQQAFMLAQEFHHLRVDALISSHLHRARQTAEILGKAFGLPVRITADLQERLAQESEQEAGRRLLTCLRETALQRGEGTIVAVSHGAIFRGTLALLSFAALRELPPGSVANTGYAVLQTDGKAWVITSTKGITRVFP